MASGGVPLVVERDAGGSAGYFLGRRMSPRLNMGP